MLTLIRAMVTMLMSIDGEDGEDFDADGGDDDGDGDGGGDVDGDLDDEFFHD